MATVFVTRKWPGTVVSRLRDEGLQVLVWPGFEAPQVDVLEERASACEVLITTVEDPVTRSVFEAGAGTLRVVAQSGVGYDNIDLEAAREFGVRVTNTPGVLDEATADLAFALMCSTARRIVAGHQYVQRGAWTCWHPSLFLGPELHRATVGIIGLGRIGMAFARRCIGFNMEILYNARKEKPGCPDAYVYTDMETLLRRSDFVSLHVPLTETTKDLIDRVALETMKSGAILVNTARGKVVDTDALVDAVAGGHLGGAGLDVTNPEPLPADHALLRLDNVIVTPHVGSAGIQTRSAMALMAADNAVAVLRGLEPANAVV